MVNIALGRGRDKIVAIADIGSGGASVAITQVPHEGPSKILASGHSALSLEAQTPEQAAGLIGQQIREAAEQALKVYGAEGHRIPVTCIYAVLHTPWVRSVTAAAEAHTAEEVRIHDALIASLAQQCLSQAKDIDRARMLEAAVIDIELNGYPVSEPAGKHAHGVRVTSLISDCDTAVRRAALGALQSLFPVAEIRWRSSLRSLATLLRSRHPHDHLLVDMGIDSTHVASVRGGVIDGRIVAEGLRSILARVGAGRLPQETLGSIRMLARDACSNESCEAVEKALALAEPELARVFGEAIGQLAAVRRVPNMLLLLTHVDLEPWLSRFFSRIDFAQFTATTLPFTVRTLSSSVAEYVEGSVADTALLSGAALVNIESRE